MINRMTGAARTGETRKIATGWGRLRLFAVHYDRKKLPGLTR